VRAAGPIAARVLEALASRSAAVVRACSVTPMAGLHQIKRENKGPAPALTLRTAAAVVADPTAQIDDGNGTPPTLTNSSVCDGAATIPVRTLTSPLDRGTAPTVLTPNAPLGCGEPRR
jgi:hypothetical protein